MMTRRHVLLGSLAAFTSGMAAMVFAEASEDKAAEGQTFEITRSEAEWRQLLTPEQFRVLRKHGTERAGSSPSTSYTIPECISARAATCLYSHPRPNTIAGPAGRVFGPRLRMPSGRQKTAPSS